MLQAPLWSRILTALILIAGILIALPTALPENIRAKIPGWLPHEPVSLGLDLQGGSSLLLEVQLDKAQAEQIENLVADIRVAFRKARIPLTDIRTQANGLSVRVTDTARMADARKIITDLTPVTGTTLLGTGGGRAYEISEPGNGVFAMTATDTYIKQNQQRILEQSYQVVYRRIDEMGTREPSIQRQGDDRILVQVPGLQDPGRLKDLLGKTAKMTFQLVDESADLAQAAKGIIPPGDELLPQQTKEGDPPLSPLVVQRRIMVSGERLTDASGGFDQRTGAPNVNFRFDTVGARQFGDVTKTNVNHRFAIVLDKQIISAPNIQEPILGGQGQITGSFTTQSANDLAVLLRAGALPVPLTVIEERSVGAELGADSVKAGSYSAIAGLALVVLFMIARYGLFGVFADVALTMNIVLLLAAITLFGGTLTLPGIAGIVLTMGMAVDANVLIYERIREEVRNGRSMLAAIDSGFKRAMATIIDANMTHLIAAAILYMVGTGPVRGFALTLGVGIITSFFTAVMVTRLIVIIWLNVRRPRRLYI